jgi:MFS family permease
MYFVTYIDRVNISTAANFIKSDFSFTNTQLGFVFSAFAYPYAILQFFGGTIADKFGARRTLLVCALIWGTATILSGFSTGLVSLFLCRVVVGVGEGASFSAATRAFQVWMPHRRGFAQGITHSSARLGNALTPPLIAALIALATWRGAFWLDGLVSLVWGVVWFWYFRDNPRDHKGMTGEDLAHLPIPADKGGKAHLPLPWGRLFVRMLPVTFTYFCYGWSLWLFLSWLPSFFLQGFGLDIKSSVLFASGVFFAGVVGDTLGGVISDAVLHRTGNVKLARVGVIVVSFLGAAVSLLPGFFTRDLTVVSVSLAAGFLFLELAIGAFWAIPGDIAPRYSGTASGLMNVGSATAAIVSPLVFGIVIDLTGNWVYPFYGSVGLLVVGAGLAFTMHPERRFVDGDG